MRAVAIGLAAILAACAAPPATTPTPSSAANVPCGSNERFERHAHAHLTIVMRGELRPVPAYIGISLTSICWLHTHDSTGIIHIEAGDSRTLTLGDFFGVWRQQLSATQIGTEKVGSGEAVKAFENQRPFEGAPETIILDDKDDIVLQLGPPYLTIPPYVWPPGF